METTTCMATPPEQVDSLIHVRHSITFTSNAALSCTSKQLDLLRALDTIFSAVLASPMLTFIFTFIYFSCRWWLTSTVCSWVA